MKTLSILLICLSFFTKIANAQESFQTFYENHKNEHGVTNFKMPAWLFKWQTSVEDKQSQKVIKKVKKVYFLISENQNHNLLNIATNILAYPLYKDVIIINEENSKITIKAKEALNIIEEIVLIIEEEKELVIICMSGSFYKEELYSLVKVANSSNIDF